LAKSDKRIIIQVKSGQGEKRRHSRFEQHCGSEKNVVIVFITLESSFLGMMAQSYFLQEAESWDSG